MDSHLPVTSTTPNPQHDTTETQFTFPYYQVISDLSIAIAEFELEKVFKDLYTGIQVETTLGWTAADTLKLVDAAKREALSSGRFEGRGSVLISAIATSELANANEALTGAFWLASISGGVTPQAFGFGGGTMAPNEPVSDLITRCSRYLSCVSSVGWARFTLLTLSTAFRHAAKHLDPDQWEKFSRLIGENKGSFELISRPLDISSDLSLSRVSEASNGWINHYASILNIQKDPNDVFDVMAVRHQLHPLRWCVSIDKSDAHMLATPYMPIEHSVLGHDFTPETDPRVNSDPHSNMIDPSKDIGGARCDMFIPASTKTCDAAPQNRQPIVELFETKGKGVGVRSLQRIEGGMILAEYAGYITKEIVFHHPYVLHGPHAVNDSRYYCITSIYQGNWTRFINHSCNPNSALTCLLLPDKEIPSVISLREIGLFEEITVSYGRGYFI